MAEQAGGGSVYKPRKKYKTKRKKKNNLSRPKKRRTASTTKPVGTGGGSNPFGPKDPFARANKDPFARPQIGGVDIPARQPLYGPPAPHKAPVDIFSPKDPFARFNKDPFARPQIGGVDIPAKQPLYGPPAPGQRGGSGRLVNRTQTGSPFEEGLFGQDPYGFKLTENKGYNPLSMAAVEFALANLNFNQNKGADKPEEDWWDGGGWGGGWGGRGSGRGGGGGGFTPYSNPWMTGLYSLSANR